MKSWCAPQVPSVKLRFWFERSYVLHVIGDHELIDILAHCLGRVDAKYLRRTTIPGLDSSSWANVHDRIGGHLERVSCKRRRHAAVGSRESSQAARCHASQHGLPASYASQHGPRSIHKYL